MTTKNVYKVSGFAKNSEYKVVADNTKEAADIFHKVVGTAYPIKEIIFLFEVVIDEYKKKMD